MKYKIIDIQQRTPEWFAWRKGKISASIMPSIMGQNPYQSCIDLYDKLINEIPTVMNEHIQRGIDNEDIALRMFMQMQNREYLPVCLESIEYPWLICSCDGFREISFEGLEEKHIDGLEIKCPRMFSSEIYGSLIPIKYYAQVQHCMAVSGAKEWHYIEYVNGIIKNCVVHRDDRYILRLIDQARYFYECLQNKTPPEQLYIEMTKEEFRECILPTNQEQEYVCHP